MVIFLKIYLIWKERACEQVGEGRGETENAETDSAPWEALS